jgi:NADPH:quinone reductase-like Zn-dependent oxidoreductase
MKGETVYAAEIVDDFPLAILILCSWLQAEVRLREDLQKLCGRVGKGKVVIEVNGAKVKEYTEGRGADKVIEAVGTPQTWETAVKLARKGGVIDEYAGCKPGNLFVPAVAVYLRILISVEFNPISILQICNQPHWSK